jgi:hypothetical protein
LHPRHLLRDARDREADFADAPHERTGRDGVPEQAVRAFPLAPAADDDEADAEDEPRQQ